MHYFEYMSRSEDERGRCDEIYHLKMDPSPKIRKA